VEVFPAASVAVATTTVVPSGNVLPERKFRTTGTGRFWLSMALTPNVIMAPLALDASAIRSPGTVSVGGVLLTTVKVLGESFWNATWPERRFDTVLFANVPVPVTPEEIQMP
jgi:hypothetical protein